LLAERWPEAVLMGSSFEGVLANGQVWRDQPAVSLLAWQDGPAEPIPLFFDPADIVIEHLVHDVCEAAGRSVFTAQDLLFLFPDALESSGLEAMLADFVPRLGEPSVAGAAASGVGGGASLAWFGAERKPAATLGLLVPGGAAAIGSRVQRAGASRFASPWLEISACRERWVDGLEGEPPLDWVRRQLGLAPAAPLEPYLDRLLVRLRDDPAVGSGTLRTDASEVSEALEENRGDFVEHYVIGLDDHRGAFSVPGGLRRGGQLALALPDPNHAREELRRAVSALAPSPLLMQFGCRARDEILHGDPDLESALVTHAARDRSVLGTLAPFQLGPDSRGLARRLVHSTVLAALGDV
jgi:small ligand-binding sensory domain FIST